VSWIFEPRGYFVIEPEAMDEEAFFELAIELGVDDINTDGDGFEIFTSPAEYNGVKATLAERKVAGAVGSLAMVPKNTVEGEGGKLATVLRMLEAFEDLDDVQNVWANFDPAGLDTIDQG
jgi:transcriptional/translational regulatory protein YebC/TACO1